MSAAPVAIAVGAGTAATRRHPAAQLTGHHAGARVDVIRHRGSLAVIPWRDLAPPKEKP